MFLHAHVQALQLIVHTAAQTGLQFLPVEFCVYAIVDAPLQGCNTAVGVYYVGGKPIAQDFVLEGQLLGLQSGENKDTVRAHLN